MMAASQHRAPNRRKGRGQHPDAYPTLQAAQIVMFIPAPVRFSMVRRHEEQFRVHWFVAHDVASSPRGFRRWAPASKSSAWTDRLWIVPAERMKGKRAHAVPLSDLAMTRFQEAFDRSGGAFAFLDRAGEAALDPKRLTRAMTRAC